MYYLQIHLNNNIYVTHEVSYKSSIPKRKFWNIYFNYNIKFFVFFCVNSKNKYNYKINVLKRYHEFQNAL